MNEWEWPGGNTNAEEGKSIKSKGEGPWGRVSATSQVSPEQPALKQVNTNLPNRHLCKTRRFQGSGLHTRSLQASAFFMYGLFCTELLERWHHWWEIAYFKEQIYKQKPVVSFPRSQPTSAPGSFPTSSWMTSSPISCSHSSYISAEPPEHLLNEQIHF